jgi:sigma-B regulation protein RsbU (phosphoserine phosphatase)
LRTLGPSSNAPVEIVHQAHRLFTHNVRFTTFVTLFIGALDLTDHTLTYCSAGHNPALLVHHHARDRARVSWLGPTGPAIGLVEEFKYREKAIELHPGDILLLYTDGVTEAANARKEQFGRNRLASVVGQSSNLPARELIQALRKELMAFSAGQQLEDDTTIVVYKIAGL